MACGWVDRWVYACMYTLLYLPVAIFTVREHLALICRRTQSGPRGERKAARGALRPNPTRGKRSIVGLGGGAMGTLGGGCIVPVSRSTWEPPQATWHTESGLSSKGDCTSRIWVSRPSVHS